MGRPRSFELDQVLDLATGVFMRLGYVGCSIADLERATALPRTSLYNAIGDKEDIFRAILARFVGQKQQYMREMVADGTIDSIIELLRTVQRGEGPLSDPSGCMIVTTAVERDKMTEKIHADLVEYRSREIAIFRSVFEAEKRRGKLAPGVDPEGAATLIVTVGWGALTTIRMFGDIAPLEKATRCMIDVLRSWQVDPPADGAAARSRGASAAREADGPKSRAARRRYAP